MVKAIARTYSPNVWLQRTTEASEKPVAALMILAEEMLVDALARESKFEIAVFEILLCRTFQPPGCV